MGMGFGFMSFLMILASGGGNELLGYVPTEAYWKARGTAVSPQALIDLLQAEKPADVAALIKDLGSDDFAKREAAQGKILALGPGVLPQIAPKVDDPDPEVSMRAKQIVEKLSSQGERGAADKLMAIRTLGELKAKEALPALEKLADSKEPFVAEYAARAAAQIQGKPLPPAVSSAKELEKDVLILPWNCGLVAQITLPGGKNVPLDKLLADLPAPMGGDKQQMLQQAMAMLMQVLDKVGNLRVDGVTLGVADNVGDNHGFVVVVGRGLYDRAKVKQALTAMHMQTETIEGMEALVPDREVAIFLPSDRQIVLVAGADSKQLPLAEVVAALGGGKAGARSRPAVPGSAPAGLDSDPAGLADNPEMMKLIQSVSPGQSLWAVAKMTDSYRVDPVLKPFEVITLQGEQAGDSLKLKLVARGKEPQEIQQAVEAFNKHLAEAKKSMAQAIQEMPPLKPLADFLDGVKVEAAEKTVTVTAELKGMSLPSAGMMMLFGVRSVSHVERVDVPMKEVAQPIE